MKVYFIDYIVFGVNIFKQLILFAGLLDFNLFSKTNTKYCIFIGKYYQI